MGSDLFSNKVEPKAFTLYMGVKSLIKAKQTLPVPIQVQPYAVVFKMDDCKTPFFFTADVYDRLSIGVFVFYRVGSQVGKKVFKVGIDITDIGYFGKVFLDKRTGFTDLFMKTHLNVMAKEEEIHFFYFWELVFFDGDDVYQILQSAIQNRCGDLQVIDYFLVVWVD